jgi:hypothetical protein
MNRPPVADVKTNTITKPETPIIMNKTLLIVANLSLLRAYHEAQNVADRQPHLELIEDLKLENAHRKCLAGHFARAAV